MKIGPQSSTYNNHHRGVQHMIIMICADVLTSLCNWMSGDYVDGTYLFCVAIQHICLYISLVEDYVYGATIIKL